MKFKDIRGYLSRIDRVSICCKEDLSYENFMRIGDVPDKYNEKYLYGFGVIESEFEIAGKTVFLPCVEFMLSDYEK
ncbi:MAG: hypothetical protein IKV41_07175 [Oscillospiraceae bacterium]|nr:hypothetical protein [Oscillospiraceae bacterium]